MIPHQDASTSCADEGQQRWPVGGVTEAQQRYMALRARGAAGCATDRGAVRSMAPCSSCSFVVRRRVVALRLRLGASVVALRFGLGDGVVALRPAQQRA